MHKGLLAVGAFVLLGAMFCTGRGEKLQNVRVQTLGDYPWRANQSEILAQLGEPVNREPHPNLSDVTNLSYFGEWSFEEWSFESRPFQIQLAVDSVLGVMFVARRTFIPRDSIAACATFIQRVAAWIEAVEPDLKPDPHFLSPLDCRHVPHKWRRLRNYRHSAIDSVPSIEIAVTWLPEGETAYTHPTKGVQGEAGDVLIELYWRQADHYKWRSVRTPAAPTVRTAPYPAAPATIRDLVNGRWYCRRGGGGFPIVLSFSRNGRFIMTPTLSGGQPIMEHQATGTWDLSSGVVTLIEGSTIIGRGRATGYSIDFAGGCSHDPNNLY